MEPRKNNPSDIDSRREETFQREDISADMSRINDEENLDTREISNAVEEGDEDYDDEELAEEDFAIDEE